MDLVPDVSVRDTNPATLFHAVSPFMVLQTPWSFLGGRVMLDASPVYAGVNVDRRVNVSGFYNTYLAAQDTWDLGDDWGLGVRMAGWVPQTGSVALDYGTLAPRIGVTHLTANEQFTVSLENGYTTGGRGIAVGPNYLNLDLTYTRTYGKLEVGVISFLSSDLNRPYSTYRKQSQAALGPLIGYDFGPVQVQAKLSTDIYEHGYGGFERRMELNINIPLWVPNYPDRKL